MPIAEFTLKPLGAVSVVLVPFEVGGTCAVVGTHITGEDFLALVDVRDVFFADTGGCETLVAHWAFVRAISTVAPCMPLHAAGEPMWRRPQDTSGTAKPTAENLRLDTMKRFQMFMHVLAQSHNFSAWLSI